MKIKRIIPVWKKPTASERQYAALLKGATDAYIREAKASFESLNFDTSIRADGIIDDLEAIFLHLRAVANSEFAGPIAQLPRIFSRVSAFNDTQWRRVIKVGTGFDFPASRDREASGLGINAYREEPWLDDLQSAWVSNNSDLIKTLPANMDAKIKQLVKSAVVNGTSAKNLADQIQEVYGNTRYRAELIAIDQIHKANAALTEHRQKDVGVTGYIWRGVEDGRERPEHKRREGQHYDWNNPPWDGHPGHPVRCRCWAEPDFTGSLFDVDS
ncbi:head morphogenesis protein [Pantoea phage vB_PagM_AAM37]|uniref:Head morphogenesis protein n=1 Tax=Pantoea phage vB_PagM_AAM37 TaxID=2588093 RepID=A0A513ZYB8_9CAUD|nr:head morphogenesis [Pantoea phage vB_PagM_AAM37]QDH45677.1 head morphogenesis protein [Pantoea phage vB_PagM_AAM37]